MLVVMRDHASQADIDHVVDLLHEAGADGAMVKVHPDPEHAKCDGPQSLVPEDFVARVERMKPLIEAEAKRVGWSE